MKKKGSGLDLPLWERSAGCPGKAALRQDDRKFFFQSFSNMDAKWLHVYERATLYGETLEIMDYSPEIDTNLKIICFPTFPGHCGCILFNADKMKSISEENHLVRLVEVSMKNNSSK